MRTVLVLGASGWLGRRFADFYRQQQETRVLTLPIDVCNTARVDNGIDSSLSPGPIDLVINCAGVTHSAAIPNIDGCIGTPRDRSRTMQVNALGAGVVAMTTKKFSPKLVHLSSGCLFDGDGIFYEDSLPNPPSYYAHTKRVGEALVQDIDPSALIVRIRMPISAYPHPRNLITKLSQAQQIVDVTNSVTVVEDLLPWIDAQVHAGVSGIVHATHPEPLPFRTLMGWYQELVDPAFTCDWIRPEEYPSLDGRSNCILGSHRPELTPMPPTDQAVRAALTAYATHRHLSEVS